MKAFSQIVRNKELDLNHMTGVDGEFYTDNRPEDLLQVVEDVISEQTWSA